MECIIEQVTNWVPNRKQQQVRKLTRVGLKGRADHGHHGGFAVAPNAVFQDPGQLAIPESQHSTIVVHVHAHLAPGDLLTGLPKQQYQPAHVLASMLGVVQVLNCLAGLLLSQSRRDYM